MATGERRDPFRGFKFRLEIGGVQRAGFMEVPGLDADEDSSEPQKEAEEEVATRQLGGLKKFANLSLKRGVIADQSVWDWHQLVLNGDIEKAGRNISIILLDGDGNEFRR
jgi:phage tail-like protein